MFAVSPMSYDRTVVGTRSNFGEKHFGMLEPVHPCGIDNTAVLGGPDFHRRKRIHDKRAGWREPCQGLKWCFSLFAGATAVNDKQVERPIAFRTPASPRVQLSHLNGPEIARERPSLAHRHARRLTDPLVGETWPYAPSSSS